MGHCEGSDVVEVSKDEVSSLLYMVGMCIHACTCTCTCICSYTCMYMFIYMHVCLQVVDAATFLCRVLAREFIFAPVSSCLSQ